LCEFRLASVNSGITVMVQGVEILVSYLFVAVGREDRAEGRVGEGRM